jgi:hypothetical protein
MNNKSIYTDKRYEIKLYALQNSLQNVMSYICYEEKGSEESVKVDVDLTYVLCTISIVYRLKENFIHKMSRTEESDATGLLYLDC